MRKYEVVYIFGSTLSAEDIESRLERYHEKILAAESSEIEAVEHWGKRQLAYPIEGRSNGYYVVAQFSADPEVLPEFERTLTLDEDLLRYLVVLSEGELPTPPSMRHERSEDEDRRREVGAIAAVPAVDTEPGTEEVQVEAEIEAEVESIATGEEEADEKGVDVMEAAESAETLAAPANSADEADKADDADEADDADDADEEEE